MKFALKISLCSILIVSVMFAFAGQLLTAQSFNTALSFRVDAAIADYSALASAMEAEIYALEYYYNTVTPAMYEEVLTRAAAARLSTVPCALYDSDHVLLAFTGGDFPESLAFADLGARRFAYTLTKADDVPYLDTAGCVSINGGYFYLAIRYDVTDLFHLRTEQINSTIVIHAVTVAVCTIAMLATAYFTSGSIRRLNAFARSIGNGRYNRRAKVTGMDEIADLTISFNNMAGAIEQKVTALEGYAKQQKDFVANFSHELKTPMTSIIGYADMLRSASLDPEDSFMAANFIFSEGKRLEALSLKLMDLVVLDKTDYVLQRGYSRRVLGHVVAVVTPMLDKNGLTLVTSVEQQQIMYERDLLLTLVTNLIDNARKSSESGKTIELTGERRGGRYRVTVKDHGIGIPKEELSRLTEAFFMVDKSRARAQHSAGLGLAICNKIAALHGSELHFESELGVGTSVWFDLPLADKRSKEATA